MFFWKKFEWALSKITGANTDFSSWCLLHAREAEREFRAVEAWSSKRGQLKASDVWSSSSTPGGRWVISLSGLNWHLEHHLKCQLDLSPTNAIKVWNLKLKQETVWKRGFPASWHFKMMRLELLGKESEIEKMSWNVSWRLRRWEQKFQQD